MCNTSVEKIKLGIEKSLRDYLLEEGIELYISANDNIQRCTEPSIELQPIEDHLLEGSQLLTEIKVILDILGKRWQCDLIVNGIYQALQPHNISHSDLTILLMSLHVETLPCPQRRHQKKRAVMRYIVEETPAFDPHESDEQPLTSVLDTEYC
jgi:hypothetical protein